MTALAHAALIGWLAVGLAAVWWRPGPRAVVAVYVLGVLFLPELRSSGFVEGVPEPLPLGLFKLTKMNAIAAGLLAGSLLFDRRRWAGVRPRWFDLPALLWCLSPLVSSVSNAVVYDDPVSKFDPAFLPPSAGRLGAAVTWLEYAGLYDGLAQSADAALTWGVPYWLGRLYLADPPALRTAVLGLVAGGVLYTPFCLAETRLSPQLHRWVYGFHQHDFLQSVRLGGYRPMVFMEHGLAVGLWMTLAAACGLWLWWAGPLRTVPLPLAARRISGLWVAVPLAAAAAACKSTGALVLGGVGLLVFALARGTGRGWPLAVLLLVPPAYAVARATGTWDGQEAVRLAAEYVDPDRAESLAFRLRNEDLLLAKALERPLVGWGGWGRSRIYNEHGFDVSVSDGLWVIACGERGLFGLVCLGLVVLLPAGRLAARAGGRPWREADWAAAGAAALVLALYAIDSLMNAMVNPVFLLLAGGLSGVPLPPRSGGQLPVRADQPVRLGRPDELRPHPVGRRPAQPPAPARVGE